MIPRFRRFLETRKPCRVLEMGAKRWDEARCTLHKQWLPEWAEFVGTDFIDGQDVDVVADAHTMSEVFGESTFDALISISVFEHITRPWIAAAEVAKVLKPGGQALIHVPFAFPEHGYPSDYFRFTKQGLRVIFEDAGLETLACDYEAPCWIQSDADPAIGGVECFSAARLLARKPD